MFTIYDIAVEEKGNTVIIYNDIYPDMFIASNAVGEAAGINYKVNCNDYMMCCDFRALVNYKRTYEDLHLVLSDKNCQVAEKIHEYNINQKIMPQKCSYFFRVEYKHKGKIVYISDLQPKNQLKINIGFAEIGGEAFKIIEKEIQKYEDNEEFTNFWRRSLKKCTNCNQSCLKKNNPIDVFGKRTLVCQSYIRIYNPKEEDLKHVFRLIDLRAMVVKAGLSEPFYPGNG